jgi:hypothetical protein
MNLRVPPAVGESLAAETARIIQMVGTVAQQHRLTASEAKRTTGGDVYLVPGYTCGPWPGQPDVDWDGGTSWTLSLTRPGDIPDVIKCAVFPPRSGRILVIVVWVDYAGRMPPAARAFWTNLRAATTAVYGPAALVKIEDLR